MSINQTAAPQSVLATPAPLQPVDVYLLQFNHLQGIGTTITFLFNPTKLTLPNTGGTEVTSYQVTFKLISNIPGSTLISEDTQSGAPPSGITATGSGTNQLTISFTNEGMTQGLTMGYKLTVLANHHTHTSDDPEIEIPPPG